MASFRDPTSDNDSFAPFSAYDALYTRPKQEIGRGASGVVRRATRRSDGETVAVKMAWGGAGSSSTSVKSTCAWCHVERARIHTKTTDGYTHAVHTH